MLLALIIPGAPVGKGRPRVALRGGHPHAYTPQPTAAWEAKAVWLARNQWGRQPPAEVPVFLDVVAVCARPQRLLRRRDPDGRIWRTSKPDGDNVLKIVADALVAAGVLRDDVFVVDWHCRCVYAARDEGPSVEVRVTLAPPVLGAQVAAGAA